MNKPEIQEIFVSWFCMATKLGPKDFFDMEDCAKGMEGNDRREGGMEWWSSGVVEWWILKKISDVRY